MINRKGIILAGGLGTRLRPLTNVISKQLLPVYDKPMIYYPISVLMLAGIQDIMIISTPRDINDYETLLGDGSNFGINLSYTVQYQPNGLAEAFILSEKFIKNHNSALILGDNIFYGQNFSNSLKDASNQTDGATIFGYMVQDPTAYGVVEMNKQNIPLSIEEKPLLPKSNIAVTGLYFYDSDVIDISKSLKPSTRGELEITEVNKHYLQTKKLRVSMLGRGFTWLDSGTIDSLLEASHFVQTVEKSQGFKIACLEEIALMKKWITIEDLEKSIQYYKSNSYGKYLQNLIS
jgi:glucose-1-phosphate thymidylyltransferase